VSHLTTIKSKSKEEAVSTTGALNGSRLHDKIAVILGAGGEVGGAVAEEFARQGARLYLSGRTGESVRALAERIVDGGGAAEAAELDALDEKAVDTHFDQVIAAEDRVDIVFNAMGPQPSEYANGTPTLNLPLAKFMLPISTIVASQFITARSAARHLLRQGAGVIVFLGATVSRGTANTSAIGAAYGALEAMTRSLAADFGPHGVRVVGVRSMGMAETRTMRQTYELAAEGMGVPPQKVEELITSRALLGRPPSLLDTARLVSFLASDEARAITGAIVNSSAGQVLD
jgi:NAD(P)-dependent dehydrogenase (short-subunit alcohol dehydrogenase family)